MRITSIVYLSLLIFFAACQSKEEKLVSPQGYQYVLHTSSGNPQPQPGEYIFFHAQMRNGDSIIYASRQLDQDPYIQVPLQENPNQPPSPVEDVLKLLGKGDSATIVINIDTLERKPPGLEDASEIYYDVAVVDVKSQEDFKTEMDKRNAEENAKREVVRAREEEVAGITTEMAEKYNQGELEGQLEETGSGLKYFILEEGQGPKPQSGNAVTVHYYGVLPDGTMFDNSFQRGAPITFPVGAGRVIPGWDEGIALLNEGSKAVFFIPPDLGYGEAGSPPVIPSNTELIFYVELEKV